MKTSTAFLSSSLIFKKFKYGVMCTVKTYKYWLTILAIGILFSGCAVFEQFTDGLPVGSVVQIEQMHTTSGKPVKMTRILLPGSGWYWDAQHTEDAVWVTYGGNKNIKINTKSNQVTVLDRPFAFGGVDLLVYDNSLWFSEGPPPFNYNFDLHRYDIETNQELVKFKGAGTPFAFNGDIVWAYNYKTATISGVNTNTNQVTKKLPLSTEPQRFLFAESFTYADGSIWQLTYRRPPPSFSLASGNVYEKIVHRIDPDSNRIIAKIPIGEFYSTDRIRFVGGAIWVLGQREHNGRATAIRIDVNTNKIASIIPLNRPVDFSDCNAIGPDPKTPVYYDGFIWISIHCRALNSSYRPINLVKVDLSSNQVIDVLYVGPDNTISMDGNLTTGGGSIWIFGGDSAIRLEFPGD